LKTILIGKIMSQYIRYIRDYLNGSFANTGNHWVQIAAWDDSKLNSNINNSNSNRAFNKLVSSNDTGGVGRTISQIVDGDISSARYFGSGPGLKFVQIDLGALYNISHIQIWHYYGDGRIYKNHQLAVSTNSVDWKIIQQPESSVKETSAGTMYWLPSDLGNIYSISTIDYKKIDQALTYINDVNKKRSTPIHNVLVSQYDKITTTSILNIRNAINVNYNVIWTQSLTDFDGKIQDVDFREINDKLRDISTNTSSCKNLCSTSCSSACTAVCYSTCGFICGNNCTHDCGSQCSHNCGSGCFASCGAACEGGCAAACAGGCAGACAGGCAGRCKGQSWGNGLGICAGTCDKSCTHACGSGCSHVCGSGCSHACGSGCLATCGTTCQGGCAAVCAGGCASTCAGGCSSSCNILCSSTCSGSCESTCTSTCISTSG